jgi:diguanylate cyclase (GGDEF)-like protein/PAS domain S-box-containing protein
MNWLRRGAFARTASKRGGDIRRLSRTYVVALVTIAALALLEQCVFQSTLERQNIDSKFVHLASSQRTVGLQIIKDLYAINQHTNKRARDQHVSQIATLVAKWIQVHEELEALDQKLDHQGVISDNVQHLLSGLNKPFTAVIECTHEIIHAPTSELDSPRLRKAYEKLDRFERMCERDMGGIVTELQTESEERGHSMQNLQFGFVLLIFAILAVEGALVFMPALQHIRKSMEAVEAAKQAIEDQQHVVQTQNQKLQEEHELLQSAAADLEAANGRIESAAKRFEELFQGLPIACFGYDPSGAIFEWNRSCEHMFNLAVTDMFSRTVYDLLCVDGNDQHLRDIVDQVFAGTSHEYLHIEYVNPDGHTQYLMCSTFPIHGQNNQISGAIFSCVDNTAQKQYELQIEEQLQRINEYSAEIEQRKSELEQANARLEALASTDGLTGLLNHRALQEALQRECRRAMRDATYTSLIMLDVDNFKAFNDTHGHPAGDAMLQQVAAILLKCARETDVIARYGGEEFVAMLPNTDAAGALQVAERMRAAIADSDWDLRSVTASFGVATGVSGQHSVSDILKAADAAMYQSKRNGKNQVTLAAPLGQDFAA